MIILIDNYDSFTWNLWHFLSDLGADVRTIRNDIYTPSEIISMKPEGIVISPGPGRPEQAGIWGALMGSFFTLFVTLILSFPIAVAAGVFLEELAPEKNYFHNSEGSDDMPAHLKSLLTNTQLTLSIIDKNV